MAGKYDSQLYALAASGLTASEAARQVGCQPSAVRRFTARTGVTFTRRSRDDQEQSVQPERGPAAMLTPDQRRDYYILMQRGQYAAEEAVEIVLRPKARIRFWRDGHGEVRA